MSYKTEAKRLNDLHGNEIECREYDKLMNRNQIYWDEFHKLFEIIQKEVELEPIKPEEDKIPEGEDIKRESQKK